MIDTHMHLVEAGRLSYPWTGDIEELAGKDFSYADYLALTGEKVTASVFMETAVADEDYQAEAAWVAQLAADPATGVVGQIASCRPEEDEGFEAWIEKAVAGLHAVGFRRILHVVDDGLSQTDRFRRNVAYIGRQGGSFDMCFMARQLPIAAELARSCDDMRLVLDHCGVPDIAADGGRPAEDWRKGVRELARLEHVACKLSGIMAYCGPGKASYEAVRPYAEHVIECFGADRVVWGSDWPVVDQGNGLPDWISVTERLLQELSEDERTKVETRNAARIYKLGRL
ncbi:MAG: amidohydrolase family protein [Betaproteobacteria bacterium AqS2]|uniref:Amidohydrolase family protein n=1 Tax=Candidatus Amphirhobacter heronislandensis TaxID=1732024 RepID=A0A930Y119_9GAMM|nr:amidohydrolase family protein [Betaproteobacteria bacterium AqS2]